MDNILKQVPKIVSLTTQTFDKNTKFLHKEKINKSTLDYILEAGWKNTHTKKQFIGKILVVGRTGCGKTTFIEKLAKNKLFGEQIKVFFGFQKLFYHIKEKKLFEKILLIKYCSFLTHKI